MKKCQDVTGRNTKISILHSDGLNFFSPTVKHFKIGHHHTKVSNKCWIFCVKEPFSRNISTALHIPSSSHHILVSYSIVERTHSDKKSKLGIPRPSAALLPVHLGPESGLSTGYLLGKKCVTKSVGVTNAVVMAQAREKKWPTLPAWVTRKEEK